MVAKKKVTKKRAVSRSSSASENSARKKTAVRRGRPPKAAASATATVKKRATKKKVSKKKAKVAASPTAASARRGRPVSVEVLQRKLSVAQDTLAKEKARRIDARKKLVAAQEAKKKLQLKLKEATAILDRMEKERKEEEKLAAQQLKMETARNEAIARFLVKWEKKYLAAQAKKAGGRGKRGRGRPRKS